MSERVSVAKLQVGVDAFFKTSLSAEWRRVTKVEKYKGTYGRVLYAVQSVSATGKRQRGVYRSREVFATRPSQIDLRTEG